MVYKDVKKMTVFDGKKTTTAVGFAPAIETTGTQNILIKQIGGAVGRVAETKEFNATNMIIPNVDAW